MASNNIKGIVIEIGGDTNGLSKALKDVDNQLKNTQRELKNVDKKLKLDPTNTELLVEKQKLLNEVVKKTAERLDTLKDAGKLAAEQLEAGAITSEQYDALQKEIGKTEEALKRATTEANNFSVGLEKAKGQFDQISNKAQKVADATKGLSTMAGAALAGIGGMAVNAAKTADELNTLAKQSGFSTEEIQKFQYAADLIDVPADTIIGSMKKIRSNMASESAATVEAWDKIGVSVKDADGNLRDANDVFYEAVAGLSEIDNETERDVVAMQLFGKNAAELSGIIDDGGVALKQYGEQASELGIILDQDTLDSLNAVNDQLDQLKANASGQIAKAGAEAMEALMPIFEDVIGYISSVLEWIGNLDTDTIQLITTVLGIVAAISPIAGLISDITGAVSGFLGFWPKITGAFDAVIGFMAANPILALIGIIGTLVALIIANWDVVKPVLDQIVDKIKKDVNGVIGIINGLINGINKLIGGINSIKINPPAWFTTLTGIGTFGLNIPKIPNIPMLANGGLLSSGSAIVGEAGAELLQMTDRGALVQPLTTNNVTNNYQTAVPAVNVNFTGNLAQLARVLQPQIAIETNRRG